jgi:Lipocalin-like domain
MTTRQMTVRPHPIVGTCRLQSFTERDIKTNARSYPMGERPKATVIYTASGHVATIFTATGRSAPISEGMLQIRSAPVLSALLNAVTEMNMTWTRAAQE